MPHSPEEKKRAITRLRRIRGQAEALETAIDTGASCSQVLQQLAAVRGAVNGLMAEVLEGHLREHLSAGDVPLAQRQADLEQVVRTLRSYLK